MTKEQEIKRAKVLFLMDNIVLDVIGDEYYTEVWLTYGVPDEEAKGDYKNLLWLTDDDTFEDIKECFFNILYKSKDKDAEKAYEQGLAEIEKN